MAGEDLTIPADRRRLAVRALLILAVLCVLAWSNSFTASFQFDDRFSVTENDRVRNFALGRILAENPTRALPEISFAFNWAVSGKAVWSYHVLSLLFHIAAAWAVWWLAALLFEAAGRRRASLGVAAPALALGVAIVFALHPVQTQAVTYISQRAAVMATLCYIGAAACYLRFRLRGGAGFYAAALALGVAGAFCKPNVASLPAAIALVEVFFGSTRRRRVWPVCVLAVAPFVLAPLAAAGLSYATGLRDASALASAGAGVTGLPTPRLYALTQLDVVRTCWRLVFLPVGLNIDHAVAPSRGLLTWPTVASAILHLAAVAGALALSARGKRLEAFGILWFYVALSVESSFVPLSDFLMEHRLYLALPGPLLALGAALGPTLAQRRFRVAFVVGAVALLAMTWRRNLVWHTPVSLWTDAARKAPASKRPLYNAANALYDAGRYREAEPYYLAALALEPEGSVVPESEGLPVRPPALRELAHLYVKTDQTDKALETLPKAIAWHPEDDGLLTDLAISHLRAGQFDQAIEPARQAARIAPDNPARHTNLGMALLRAGRPNEAREALQKAVRLAPRDARPLIYLAEIEEASGNASGAVRLLRQAVELARGQGAPEAVIQNLLERIRKLEDTP